MWEAVLNKLKQEANMQSVFSHAIFTFVKEDV